MVLERQGSPLVAREIPAPQLGARQILIRVSVCAVCRTDLHVVDGDLEQPKLPLVPGHQIVGEVVDIGAGVARFKRGDRAGVPWLGSTCGACKYCKTGRENLCDEAHFTGYDIDGGYAELAAASEDFAFHIPEPFSDEQAAPLLCAGLIGFRSYRMTGDAETIGFYGFGSSAHVIARIASAEKRKVFAFTRKDDVAAQQFALRHGASWAGASGDEPPEELDAAIIFAPAGELVPLALSNVRKGGVVVCAGIHMSDIPSFPYSILWGERVVRSVANLTRRDAEEFLPMAARLGIRSETTLFELGEANEALRQLRAGELTGTAVLHA